MPILATPSTITTIGALAAPISFRDVQPYQQGQPGLVRSSVSTRSLYGALIQPRFGNPYINSTISAAQVAQAIKRVTITLAADLAAGAALDIAIPGITNAAYTALDAAIGTPGTAGTPPTTPDKVLRVIVTDPDDGLRQGAPVTIAVPGARAAATR